MAEAVALLAILLALLWGGSGLTRVPMDARAVEERNGTPVRVLQPGLHALLPWPFSRTRRVEFGQVHSIALGAFRSGSDMDASPAALVTASGGGKAGVQSISVTVDMLFRVGLTDADALAARKIEAPDALVLAAARQMLTRYAAMHTLDAVMATGRSALGEELRRALQQALDTGEPSIGEPSIGAPGIGATGIEAVAVIIADVRPPEGAAASYQDARATEIAARTGIAVAHGEAAAIAARARQAAYAMTSVAHAHAAEVVDGARAGLIRFTADQGAARAGGSAFLLERYFGSLAGALAGAPKTIIDHRLNWPEAPVLDLRPFAPASATGAGKEE